MNDHVKDNPLSIFKITTNMFHQIEKQYVIKSIDKDYVTIFIVDAQCHEIEINIDNFT